MIPMVNKNSLNKNFTTSNAGLKIYADLWDKYGLSGIFDSVVKKYSGPRYSQIAQNLFFRLLVDANSMVALSEKDNQEYFLQQNACLDRTTYGRNLKRLNGEQRASVLLKFNNNLIKAEDLDEDSLMIYDMTAIEANGETYENTKQVYDSCQEKMIQGYALNKLMISAKKKLTMLDFNLQDNSKETTIEMFKRGRRLTGVNKVVFDAGPDLRGMDFFKELDDEGFLFYTKAVNNWYFNYGKDYTVDELKEVIKPRLKREGMVSLEVWKDDMLLRLVFVLNDPRVYLTNDLEIPAGKIVGYYKRRWEIEVSFREEKQNLGLGVLPCRKLKGIKTHVLLALLAYILSQFIIAKVKIADGIKLIKRRIVQVFATIIEKYHQITLEFKSTYKHWRVFNLDFG